MIITNIFSEKNKDCVMEDKFKSMKQLDRIEFQNKIVQQNQELSTLKITQSTFMIVNFISLSFLVYYSGTFVYLLLLEVFSEIHQQSGAFFFMMFIITSLLFFYVFINRMLVSNKFKEQNDEQLDLILNKK